MVICGLDTDDARTYGAINSLDPAEMDETSLLKTTILHLKQLQSISGIAFDVSFVLNDNRLSRIEMFAANNPSTEIHKNFLDGALGKADFDGLDFIEYNRANITYKITSNPRDDSSKIIIEF